MKKCIGVMGLLSIATSLLIVDHSARCDDVATRAILSVTPFDMAGCVIIEDLAPYCDRMGKSPFWNRLTNLPIAKTVLDKPEIRSLFAIKTLLPAIAGVQWEELRDRVLGNSVVLAFRPSKGAGDADAGIVYCHVADPDVRKRFWDAMTRPTFGRTTESRKHKNVEYVRRIEGAKTEFLVQLDSVLGLTDREALVQASIDARLTRHSLLTTQAISDSATQLPAGCLVRILLDPRGFDGAVTAATQRGTTPLEKETGATLLQSWKALSWAAITVRIDERAEFGCHASLDLNALPSDVRTWLERTQKPAEVWKLAPANALMAATCEVDFADLGRSIEAMLKSSTDADAKVVSDILSQLIPGYDLQADVMPRLGPESSLIVAPASSKPVAGNGAGPGAKLSAGGFSASLSSVMPHVVACVRINADGAPPAGLLPLHDAIESGLRPWLVLAGIEHNRKNADTVRVNMSVFGANRVHSLAGSKLLPAWLEPAFCTTRDWLVLGSSSAAIKEILSATSGSLADSRNFKSLVERLPRGFTMTMYLSVRQLRETLASVDPRILDFSKAAQNSPAGQPLKSAQSVLGLFEAIVAGTSNDGAVFHWTAFIVPAPDASMR